VDPLSLPTWAERALADLHGRGVQIWGVADGTPWQAILPGCRSVLVVGSGGRALWELLQDRRAAGWAPDDPVDALVSEALEPHLGAAGCRWVRCAEDEPCFVDFRRLGLEAGLAHPSRLGLLLHPVYGPWWGLRAACFTTEDLPLSRPLASAPPCGACPAPCATACPVGAPREPTLDLEACLSWQRAETTCAGGCLARMACPEGPQHAYSAAQHRYHHHPPSRAAQWRPHQAGSVA
jgi:hypothetical protein